MGGWFYRGQSDSEWGLVPNENRFPYYDENGFDFKFKMWLKHSHNYPNMKFSNDIEAMAIAQHHGFPTKLLDWSSNILTATFFACASNFDKDGKLITYFPTQYIYLGDDLSSVEISRVVGYQPKAVAERLKTQSGYFTYHKEQRFKIVNEYFRPGNHETLME
ncbi:MAG: FRG domain-containing protein [Candidatus Thiodiazotropha taylori]